MIKHQPAVETVDESHCDDSNDGCDDANAQQYVEDCADASHCGDDHGSDSGDESTTTRTGIAASALLAHAYLFHPVSPTQDIYGSSIAIWMAASWRNLYQGEKGGTSIDTHPFLLTYPTQFANQTRPRRVDDRTIKCETQRVKEEPKNGNEEEDPTAHSKSKSNKETPRPTAPPTLPTVTRKFHGGNRSSNIATAR